MDVAGSLFLLEKLTPFPNDRLHLIEEIVHRSAIRKSPAHRQAFGPVDCLGQVADRFDGGVLEVEI